MKINEIVNEMTSAGGIAVVAQPVGDTITRPNPSVFPTKIRKTKKPKKGNQHDRT